MAITARFKGGPRNGRKNSLKNFNEAPARLPVAESETKAVNMKPGRYVKSDESLDGTVAIYVWERTYAEETA